MAQSGSDIVCAAVSVLTENLGAGIQHLLKIPCRAESEKGYYSLHIEQSNLNRDTDLLLTSAFLGLQTLSEQYPDRIGIKRSEHGT